MNAQASAFSFSDRRKWCASLLSAACISLFLALGCELRACEGLGFSWGKRAALFTPVFVLLSAALLFAQCLLERRPTARTPTRTPRFIPLFLLFFLCYVPALLAYCPGIIAYDATAQILQGINASYTAYHPIVHTLLLSGCVRLGNALHSYTLGAGLYTLLQMAALSALFACCVRTLSQLGASRLALIVVSVLYAFYPVHAIMAISSTKDTLFSGLTALLVLRTIAALREGEAFFRSRRQVVSYVLLCVCTCLFRNNGVLALLGMGVVCIVLHKGLRRRLTALLAACVLAYVGVQSALIAAFNAETTRSLDVFSLPIAQMARVAQRHGDELESDLAAALETYMPLGEENPYDPHLVDPVKMQMDKDSFTRDPAAFLSLYLRLGKAYPDEYLDAALLLNQGAWDPLDTSVGSIYHMWEAGQHGYLQTKFQRHIDDENGIRIEQKSLLPGLYRLYERFCTENIHQQNPFTNLLFAPASMMCLCLIAFAFFLAQRRRAEAGAAAFLMTLFLTQLLGPCALVRYAYPFFTCAPLLLALLPCRPSAPGKAQSAAGSPAD